jgi:hypothetical protein
MFNPDSKVPALIPTATSWLSSVMMITVPTPVVTALF